MSNHKSAQKHDPMSILGAILTEACDVLTDHFAKRCEEERARLLESVLEQSRNDLRLKRNEAREAFDRAAARFAQVDVRWDEAYEAWTQAGARLAHFEQLVDD